MNKGERQNPIELLNHPDRMKFYDRQFFTSVEFLKWIGKFDPNKYRYGGMRMDDIYSMSTKENIDKWIEESRKHPYYDILQITIQVLNENFMIPYISNVKKEVMRFHVWYIDNKISEQINENNVVENLGMTDEDYDKYSNIAMSLSMLTDSFEVLIKDMNDILKRYSAKDASYKGVLEMCNELRKITLTAHKWAEVKNDELFGDECDKLIEMIKKKAQSMSKKWEAKQSRMNKKNNKQ